MFKFINKIKNKEYSKEKGFSLLELSVAVGIAAIVGAVGIVATTGFIGTAETKKDNYVANADGSIEDAESSSLALLQGNAENLVPIAPVSNAVTSGATTDSVTISWAAPLGISAPITSYTIFVDDAELETVDASVTSYELTELSAGTSYDVTIRATNSNGSEDATFTVTTESPAAPSVPTTVLASNITSTGTTLTWDAPEDGEVEEYIIELAWSGSADDAPEGAPQEGSSSNEVLGYELTVILDSGVQEEYTSNSVFSYEFTGLTVNTDYEAKVFAKSPDGAISEAAATTFIPEFSPMVATGGDKVYDIVQNGIEYRVHEFTTVGESSFVVTDAGESGEVEYLIVGGGASGMAQSSGHPSTSGGGGAGGYRSNVQGETSGGGSPAEDSLSIGSGEYAVVVGNGGQSRTVGGKDSTFDSIVSLGGGAGGIARSDVSPRPGQHGGSAGGGSWHHYNYTSKGIPGGSGEPGQGFNGANAKSGSRGGGGGGAGSSASGARGGDGVQSSITGASKYYAGGGGGAGRTGKGSGGQGGGGFGAINNSLVNAANGADNTGGGGGGGHRVKGSQGNGGAGIVIVRYPVGIVN